MARVCSVCEKRGRVGNRVSHANNRTKRVFRPNLKHVWAMVGVTAQRIRVCTGCIRSGKITKPALVR